MQLYDHNNLERLYLGTLGTGIKTLAVAGVEPNVGCTTLAMALAQRHLLAHHSVLYVELNSLAPSLSALCQLDTETSGSTPMLVGSSVSDAVVTGVLAPQDKLHIVELRQPQRLAQYIEELSQGFDAIVIDCAPLCGHIDEESALAVPADIVARVTDNTILVIKGGVTKAPVLKRALGLMKSQNVEPTAIAINQQFNPSLGQELIREADRLKPFAPKVSRWIAQKIRASLLMQPL